MPAAPGSSAGPTSGRIRDPRSRLGGRNWARRTRRGDPARAPFERRPRSSPAATREPRRSGSSAAQGASACACSAGETPLRNPTISSVERAGTPAAAGAATISPARSPVVADRSRRRRRDIVLALLQCDEGLESPGWIGHLRVARRSQRAERRSVHTADRAARLRGGLLAHASPPELPGRRPRPPV